MSDAPDPELERMRARLVELEVRYTHQETLLADLSDVIYEQRRVLDQVNKRLTALERRLADVDAVGGPRDPKDDVPPHY
jgi:SlyX protein